MAKKKQQKEEPEFLEIDKYLKTVEKGLSKIVDASNFTSADFVLDSPPQIIPVSPAIDVALGGGITDGSWNIFSGPSKCGKTIMALTVARNAQKMGKKVFFINIEGRISELQLKGVHGLQIKEISMVMSTREKILSGQQFLDASMAIMENNPDCVVIIDSYSVICSSNERDSEITAFYRNEGPKLLASFTRQMSQVVPVNNITVVGMQHVIANQASRYGGVIEDGGNKIIYQTDTKLRCSRVQSWEEDDKVVGQIVTWKVMNSALGGGKHTEVETYLRFGYGYDDIAENIILASEFGVIEKGGSWFTLPDGQKVQGLGKLRGLLLEDTELYQKINQHVREIAFGE